MDDDTNEVLFETWLYKLSGINTQNSKSLSNSWKKRYFVLLREDTSASLLYYVRKPKHGQLVPKGFVRLQPYYKILKKPRSKDKYVCELVTEGRRLLLATDDAKIYHLLYFFLQTQTKIRDHLEDKCYVVRPDNTEDQRRVGATANMSLLHVSQWGVTLALELSRCVLAQWPLNCIKNYECSDSGQFSFETGRRSPTGEGHYMFRTRQGHDRQIFNLLDSYVDKAAAIQQQLLSSRSSAIDDIRGSLCDSEMELQQVTYVCSDGSFTAHLQRISRNIYDHLLTHIGASSLSFRNVSDVDAASISHLSRQRQQQSVQRKKDSPPVTESCPHSEVVGPPLMTPVSGNNKVVLQSQYLHMGASSPPEEEAGGGGGGDGRYVNVQQLRSGDQEPRYAGIHSSLSRSCDHLANNNDDDYDAKTHVYHNDMFETSAEDVKESTDFFSLSRASKKRTPETRRRQAMLRRSVSNPDLLDSDPVLPGFRQRAAALKLRLFMTQASVNKLDLSPSKQSAKRLAESVKDSRFTDKSRSFVKHTSVADVWPEETSSNSSTPPLVRIMEGRQLPNLPPTAQHSSVV